MDNLKRYQVTSTPDAEADVLRHYLYIKLRLKNPEAADAYLEDFDDTVEMLSKAAGSLRIGDDPIIRSRDLRRINLMRHDYFIVYFIDEDEAVIIAVGHHDEDLHNVIR